MTICKNSRGFSLIELLIALGVLMIIAGISIPNLLASRRAANEASAIGTIRAVSNAQHSYFTSLGNNNYGSASQLYNQQLIDKAVAAANNLSVGGSPPRNQAKSGYLFDIQTTTYRASTGRQATYVVCGNPSVTSGIKRTGAMRFCSTQDGVIRGSLSSLSSVFSYDECRVEKALKP